MDHRRSSTKLCKYVAHEDFISNLPDGLKDKILCCLPIKEAVATCLLSRNWRYTWTSMTELMFRGDDFASENGNVNDDHAEHEFLVLKPPKSFNRLTKISLDLDLGNLKEANLALYLFQHAPYLQLINLQLTSKKPMVPAVHFWESIDRHVCLFQNVRVVGMINFTGSGAELGFLKLILEDAPVLKKALIKDYGKLGKDDLKNLLKMRRASKDAEIVILSGSVPPL
ncbi:hypothetical protein ACQ4PT_055885 [Festuca glaucescens]